MRVLVTGSNGFIGSCICKRLHEDHYVIGCGTTNCSKTEDVDAYFQWKIGMEPIPETLNDIHIDAIVHAAASKNLDDESQVLMYTNCMGSHQIFVLAKDKCVKRVVYLSSIPIIGKPVDRKITENIVIAPLTMYHATKASGEYILNQLEKYNISEVNLRIPSPIGPGLKVRNIVNIFLANAMEGKDIVINGAGTREQNYIDVRDIAEAIYKILAKDKISGTYNIGSQRTVSNIELAKLCIEITGHKSNIVFSGNQDSTDNQVWDIDIAKLERDTDFVPKYDIRQTLMDMKMHFEGEL